MENEYERNYYFKPSPPPPMPDEERAWREGWAFAYSGARHLYGDDGELQDNRHPTIDWMRDTALEIKSKIHDRAMARWVSANA